MLMQKPAAAIPGCVLLLLILQLLLLLVFRLLLLLLLLILLLPLPCSSPSLRCYDPASTTQALYYHRKEAVACKPHLALQAHTASLLQGLEEARIRYLQTCGSPSTCGWEDLLHRKSHTDTLRLRGSNIHVVPQLQKIMF